MDVSKEKNENKSLSNFKYVLLFFFLYAFLGWLLESGYAIYNLGEFVKRGFLYGPICPIYGFGAVILILFLQKYKDNSIKLFIYSALIFSILEYFVSFGLEALFHAKWWDYTNEFFNLNGRISIFYSFVWGIFGILFINNIHPFFEKHINNILQKLSYSLQTIILNIITLIYFLDTTFSVIKYMI